MPSVNQVVLAGNLTRDPELKRTASGSAVCHLRLAISEVYTGKDGQRHESACFVDVDAWNAQAEACGEYLRKGSAALVQGKLVLDQWETSEGEKRSRLKVHGMRVEFLGRPPQSQDAEERAQPAHAEEAPF